MKKRRIDVAAMRRYVVERGIRFGWIANEAGMTKNAMTLTMQGKREVKANEYIGICDALGVGLDTFIA